MRSLPILLTAAFLLCVGPKIARADLAQTILTAWPGTWSCVVTTSTTSPVSLTLHATTYGKWVQFSGVMPAHGVNPARPFVMVLSYNQQAKKWFIDSYSSGGGLILASSTAGPNQRRQAWTNIYPTGAAQQLGTIVMDDKTWKSYNASTTRGKHFTATTSCEKS